MHAQKVFKAAVYVRLSKEDENTALGNQSESNSVTNQKAMIIDFLNKKENIEIVSIHCDDGYTGTDYDRPGFQQMLEEIRSGAVNCVCVKDLSRLGREYIGADRIIHRLFAQYGVRLISINDNIDFIPGDVSESLSVTIRNLFNDSYSRDISIKIRASLQTKRNHGEYVGAFTPYGYRRSETERNRLIIDPYPASIVQEIYRMKIAGMNLDSIAKNLNSRGVLSPLMYKQSQNINYSSGFQQNAKTEWSPVAVRRILKNEVYTGTLIQGARTTPNYKVHVERKKPRESCSVVYNSHEAIVSRREYSLVQRLLELDTRTSPKLERVYPLAGFVECGDCHQPMIRMTIKNKYTYYVCNGYKQHRNCTAHRIPASKLETAVLATIQNQVRLALELDACMKKIEIQKHRDIRIDLEKKHQEALMAEITKYIQLKAHLYEDLTEGIVTRKDYTDINAAYTELLENTEAALETSKKQLEELLSGNTEKNRWIDSFLKFRNLSELTRNAVVELIERIFVYENSIYVEFQHHDQFEMLATQLLALESDTNTTSERENQGVNGEGVFAEAEPPKNLQPNETVPFS